jgi:hypothetical protein
MVKENKDYLNSQKELGKLDNKVIDTIASELEKRYKAKGIVFDGEITRKQLGKFRDGWEFEYTFDDGLLLLEWREHPLIEYEDEQVAQILYKFFKGNLSHFFKNNIMALVRFLKSIRDPNILLKSEPNTVKEIMKLKQLEEIKDKMKKIDVNAVIEVIE